MQRKKEKDFKVIRERMNVVKLLKIGENLTINGIVKDKKKEKHEKIIS